MLPKKSTSILYEENITFNKLIFHQNSKCVLLSPKSIKVLYAQGDKPRL